MSISSTEAQDVYARAMQLYSQAQIDTVLDRLGTEITRDLKEKNPLVLCVMVGGLIFAGQVITRLNFPLQIDYIHASRYRGDTAGGELHWIAHPSCSLKDRVILLLDDILDEGLTLAAICEACRSEGAREVLTAVLVEKLHDRKNGVQADYMGVQVEDRYVFGYGMDYKGFLRNAPGIYAVQD